MSGHAAGLFPPAGLGSHGARGTYVVRCCIGWGWGWDGCPHIHTSKHLTQIIHKQAVTALRLPSSSSARSRGTALFQFLHPPSSTHAPTHSPSCSCCASSLRPKATTTRLYLSPPEYDMIHVAGDVVAGFVGGAVGVMGTIMALEVKMRQVNERSKCPYCSGSG